MKKEGSSVDSWVDPASPRGELAVRFDRETGSLKLIRKGEAVQGRGCLMLFWSVFALVEGTLLVIALIWNLRSLWFWASCGLFFLPILAIIYEQEVEIDTRTRRLLRRARGMCFPWTMTSSISIGDAACFTVRAERDQEAPGRFVLYFVPYPDAWFTFWRPMPIGATYDASEGKLALERMAFGLNRFLDAVRKGEPNLERLAQPAPPGPFKP